LIRQQFASLPFALEREPPPFEGNDVKYPESLVRFFLTKLTFSGARVFDPFAGLGTTLFVAEEMHRIPFGVECDPRRFAWVAGQLACWPNLVCGDSRELASLGFPKMDFAMTSPPFMARNHRWNPLCAGNPAHAGYETYLAMLQRIFRQLAQVMKRNAHVVVHVDNLPGRTYTPLVRDMGAAIDGILRLQTEMVIAWEGGPKNYRHTHCLVFKAV
jgi:hypothetical protein